MQGLGNSEQHHSSWKETGCYGKKAADKDREDMANRLSEEEQHIKQGASNVLEGVQEAFNKLLGRTEQASQDAHDTVKVCCPSWSLPCRFLTGIVPGRPLVVP
jgi:hypothetical protein